MLKPRELKNQFLNGQNISKILRDDLNLNQNNQEIIEIAYDLQAGSYRNAMVNTDYANNRKMHSFEIARIIQSLCKPDSVLEAGVGEATVFSGVINQLSLDVKAYGFDISWSRLASAREWLSETNTKFEKLCVGDLLNIPFLDNSIDVVYTSHSIEPNGGKEMSILKELYRVTRKYLILVEPDYEIASEESRQRMDSHGYCKNLKSEAANLGFNIVKHEPFPINSNPLNPISATVISKMNNDQLPESVYACPKFKTPLIKRNDAYFSEDALVAYPILDGIPCLRIENGIFASRYLDTVDKG